MRENKALRLVIRNILLEDIYFGGFHGNGMVPSALARANGPGACSMEWKTDDAKSDSGCPQFSHSNPVPKSDIDLAVKYLNEEQPTTMVVYSRGAAVFCMAMEVPNVFIPENVTFLSPAWKRWGSVKNSTIASKLTSSNCRVVIGEADPRVPVKHAHELASLLGTNLEILFHSDHTTGKDFLNQEFSGYSESLLDELPEEMFRSQEPIKLSSGALIYLWNGLSGTKTYTVANPSELPEWDDKSFASKKDLLKQISAIRG